RLYRWHRRDRWWPTADVGPSAHLSEQEASRELLAHWLTRFGPATLADMKWWTGWTMTKTRRTLAAIDAVEVQVEVGVGAEGAGVRSEAGYLMADDAEPIAANGPWAALLPSLDPTPMGWKDRAWYLGPHKEELFDRNGNIGPTVWVDGRIVGGWAQRPDGEVVVALLEEVGADHRAMIDAEVDFVSRFVGPVVVKPSFPTPLQKRLSTG
ncbi:MAG: crosslink repair DNA glycosylase YcaQ family protein, partial [Acidimicrobiales bacterium]